MDCREAVGLVTEYLEGALSDADRRRFEDHLRYCPHCEEYLTQIRVTISTLGRVEPNVLTREAREELVRLYRRWQSD
jgi:anti-sigma factor RsiW